MHRRKKYEYCILDQFDNYLLFDMEVAQKKSVNLLYALPSFYNVLLKERHQDFRR